MSSDSEDDSFLNIARKLSGLTKTNVIADLEPEYDNEHQKASTSPPTKKRNKKQLPGKTVTRRKSTDSDSNSSIDLEKFRSEFPPLVAKRKTRNTRASRGTKRQTAQDSPDLADTQACLPKRRRKNNASTSTAISINSDASEPEVSNEPPVNRRRGRGGRGRGSRRGRARGRGRNSSRDLNSDNTPNILDILRSLIPTYSVGNTDEYPDQSDNVQLFGSRKQNVPVEEEENDTSDFNEEVAVIVKWQSTEYYRFQLRQHQKITSIFNHFAKEQNVDHDKLLFTYKDAILKPEDTPDSIDYSVAKCIEGGIVNQSVSHSLSSNSAADVKNGVKLKFQCQNEKKPFEIHVNPHDTLSSAMVKCAEHFEKPIGRLRFEFDGDNISGRKLSLQ